MTPTDLKKVYSVVYIFLINFRRFLLQLFSEHLREDTTKYAVFCFQEPWFDNPEVSTVPVVPAERLKSPFTPFPLLSEIQINSYLTKSNESPHKTFQVPAKELQKVPISSYDLPVTHFINQRRLEVIQDCIQYIYENKTSDALKVCQVFQYVIYKSTFR